MNVLVNVLIQVIFPVIFYFLLITFLDTHVNRSDSPAGMFYYTATPVSVFLPYDIVLMKPYSLLFNYNYTMFEGVSYIGLLSNLFIIGMLLYLVFFLIKKQLRRITGLFNNNWLLFIISAIIILLFSMGVLYDLGFDILLKYLKPLRQFRVLGRFSWPFYYIIFIFSVVTLYKVYEYFKLKKWSKVFIAIIIAIPLYESIAFQKNISSDFLNNKNIFESKYLPDKYKEILSKIDIQKYQAILPIPIFHYGSEDFMLEPESASQYNTMVIGYYTKLPFLSGISGRTSVDEAKKIIQILTPSFYYKEIVNDIHSDKPFLILYSKININEYEREVLSKATKIAEIDDIELLEISKEKLFEYDNKQIVKDYSIHNDSTFIKNNYVITDTNAQVFYENFDYKNSIEKQYSIGAYSCNISNDNTVYKFKIDKIDSAEDYELSFWTNNKVHGSTRYMVALIEIAEDGKSDWLTYTDGRFCPIIYKDWSLVQLKFKARKNYNYELFIPYRRELYDSIYIDNLLVRPLKVDFYTVLNNNNNGVILYNNQVVETKIPYLLLKCSKEIFVEEYIREIKNSVEWFNFIKNDAKKLNKPIDEVIKANAEYMYYEKAYNIPDPKEFIIAYYVHVIKNDSSWLKSLLERPDNKGKNIEDVIYQNA
ncbi:MAG: YfhO family protein, partial [Bacteroidales bacterium]|nr:YfhO family protein [Bacteroidales bacterium]